MKRGVWSWTCVVLAGATLAFVYTFTSPDKEERSFQLAEPNETKAGSTEQEARVGGIDPSQKVGRAKLPSAPPSHAAPSDTAPPTGTARVMGLFVGPAGEPVPGVRAFASYTGNRLLATGDEEGKVDFHVQPPPFDPKTPQSLYFLADGYRSSTWVADYKAGSELRLGRVVLAYGAKIIGRISDPSGAPLFGASITYTSSTPQAQRHAQTLPAATSDEAGDYEVPGVGPGTWLVTARTGLFEATSGPVDVRAGDTVRVDLSLSVPSDALLIEVVDPERVPVPNAWVEYEYAPSDPEDAAFLAARDTSLKRRYTTDPLGRIRLRFGEAQEVRIRALDRIGRFSPSAFQPVGPAQLGANGTHPLQLVLQESQRLVIALLDADRSPIPWGHVGLRNRPGLIETGADGHAELALPTDTFHVDAMAPGYRRTEFGPFDPTDIDGPLELVMRAGHSFAGRVLHHGRPIAGAKLGLYALNGPHLSGSVAGVDSPFTIIGEVGPQANDATTDDQGRFRMTLHQAAQYAVRITAEGFASQVLGPWYLVPSENPSFDLPLERAGSLGGKVLGDASGLDFGPNPGLASEILIAISDGWGFARTTPIQPDGTYHFEDVPVGPWQVRAVLPPVSSVERLDRGQRVNLEDTPHYDTFVKPDSHARYDVDLDRAFASILVGRIDAEYCEGVAVRLARADLEGGAVARTTVNASGDFQVATSYTGPVTLTLVKGSIRIQDSFDIDGFRSWNARLDVATLEPFGEVRADWARWLRVETTLLNGARAWTSVLLDLPEENAAPYQIQVPAGHCRIYVGNAPVTDVEPTLERIIAPGEVVPFQVD